MAGAEDEDEAREAGAQADTPLAVDTVADRVSYGLGLGDEAKPRGHPGDAAFADPDACAGSGSEDSAGSGSAEAEEESVHRRGGGSFGNHKSSASGTAEDMQTQTLEAGGSGSAGQDGSGSGAHEGCADETLMMCVGSQLAFKIRETLFRRYGLTTSCGVGEGGLRGEVSGSVCGCVS